MIADDKPPEPAASPAPPGRPRPAESDAYPGWSIKDMIESILARYRAERTGKEQEKG